MFLLSVSCGGNDRLWGMDHLLAGQTSIVILPHLTNDEDWQWRTPLSYSDSVSLSPSCSLVTNTDADRASRPFQLDIMFMAGSLTCYNQFSNLYPHKKFGLSFKVFVFILTNHQAMMQNLLYKNLNGVLRLVKNLKNERDKLEFWFTWWVYRSPEGFYCQYISDFSDWYHLDNI